MKPPHKLIYIQALSSLSLWLDIFLIFTVPVYMWNASPSSIALLAFLLGAPMLFLGPIVGTFIDRHDIRNTLVFGAILRTTSTTLLAYSSNLNIFLALVFLKGTANLIYFPSITIAVRQLVNAEDRKSFFSQTSLIDQISKIATPILAGLLTILIAPKDIFLLSAISVLISIPILVSICTLIQPPLKNSSENILSLYRDILRGFTIFKSLPFQLRMGFLYSLMTSMALGIYDPHLASFLSSEGLSSVIFSWIISATAGGAVCAALLVKFKFNNVDEFALRTFALTTFSAALTITAALVLIDVPGKKLLYPAVWFLNGFGYEILIISSNIILQQCCPANNIGRVSTSFRSAQILCVIVGPTIGTILIAAFGRTTPFIVAAITAFLTAIISIVIRHHYKTPVNSSPN